jgi:phospholipid/cholesterol/gamma-HCH transport system substrate-binding protein
MLGLRGQIGRHAQDFLMVVGIVVVAVLVGGYIVAHQRLEVPGWVPFVGEQGYTLRAEFETAQGVMPGQGQPVTVAGVTVGSVQSVDLEQGRAVITMRIDDGSDVQVHRDATLLLRPKTGLKDMAVALTPGQASSPRLPSGSTLSVAQTSPDVNLDEFLSGLDADTQTYLQFLLAGAGMGLHGNKANLSSVLRRFDPTARDLNEIGQLLSQRQTNIKHAIHNFRRFVEAVGAKDSQLSQFVDASAVVLRTFASEDASLRATLAELPTALSHTTAGMAKVKKLTDVAGPTLRRIEPTSKNLGPGMRAVIPVLRDTPPIIKNQLSPFATATKPVLDTLVPATKDLLPLTASLTTTFNVFDEVLNALAYNPSSKQAGFLFYAAWASHNLNSVLSSQDANGPFGRSLLLQDCKSRGLLGSAAKSNSTVRLLVDLWNPPSQAQLGCPVDTAAVTRGSASLTDTPQVRR